MQSQQPDDHNNIILAAILSMLVLLAWNYFYAQPEIERHQERIAAEQKKAAEAKKADGKAPAQQDTSEAQQPSTLAASRDEALSRSPRVAIESPSLKGSIALKGALIDDLVLTNYRETADPSSPNVVLLSPPDAPTAYFAHFGWTAANPNQKMPGFTTVWKQDSTGALTPSSPLKLSWDNGNGLVFRRTLEIDDKYMFTISDEVENKSGGDVALKHYGRLFRFGTPETVGFVILHEGLIGVPGDEGLQEISYSDAVEPDGNKTFQGKTGGWLGITDKYWAAALIPDQSSAYTALFSGEKGTNGGRDRYLVEDEISGLIAPAGQTKTVVSHFYAGAKQVRAVEDYEEALGIEKFELMIDWGWFYFITKPFAHLINWLYEILGNFGLAILAITVLVKLVFYPLANKSYVSMAKMKKLQPQMEALRERFKDDKARQQQELMALYQKEKINPLAGCLPILVQIPVFFALYKVLFVSIDMRHAPFFGWIKDLSAADPTSIFNLFGLLPFAVPELLQIGVWPLIMGLTMWFQMQLNPPQPDPIQQQIFAWMPVIFTVLLASFPAGLVIYWAWNNVLSIAQQWHISHKQGADIHLVENLKRTFGPIIRLIKRDEEPKNE